VQAGQLRRPNPTGHSSQAHPEGLTPSVPPPRGSTPRWSARRRPTRPPTGRAPPWHGLCLRRCRAAPVRLLGADPLGAKVGKALPHNTSARL